eukprot:GHVU01076526.1.p1 GENE.GHVU01076526.1~~GHVU01076526.1.p1  ORF type:complete len:578 (-),score=-14.82 GHVU01076526.1:21-1586(-)
MSAQHNARLYRDFSLLACFVDLTKAFDSLPRPAIWQALEAHGVPPRMVTVIRGFHTSPTGTLRCNDITEGAGSFLMERGVRQGCVLGPILFNFFFAQMLFEANAGKPEIGLELQPLKAVSSITVPAATPKINFVLSRGCYADDLAALGRDGPECSESIDRVDDVGKPMGVGMSEEKTISVLLAGNPLDPTVRLKGLELATRSQFTYLGVEISETGGSAVAIRTRLAKARSALSGLAGILKCPFLSTHTKCNLFMQICVPTLLYGCETWISTKRNYEELEAFFNDARRIILGVKRSDKVRREVLREKVSLPAARRVLALRRVTYARKWLGPKCSSLPCRVLFSSVEIPQDYLVPGCRKQEWLRRVVSDIGYLVGQNCNEPTARKTLQLILNTDKERLDARRPWLRTRNIEYFQRQADLKPIDTLTDNLDGSIEVPNAHGSSGPVVYSCPIERCEYKCVNPNTLRTHQGKHHKQVEIPQDRKKCPVPLCYMSYTCGWRLCKHMQSCHSSWSNFTSDQTVPTSH